MSTLAASGVVLASDDFVFETREAIFAAMRIDAVYPCRFGVHSLTCPERPWPCGYAHAGEGVYHLAHGRGWADFTEGVLRSKGHRPTVEIMREQQIAAERERVLREGR